MVVHIGQVHGRNWGIQAQKLVPDWSRKCPTCHNLLAGNWFYYDNQTYDECKNCADKRARKQRYYNIPERR